MRDIFQPVNNFEKNKNIGSRLILGSRVKNAVLTVVIPTFKRPSLLRASLLSVINQNFSYKYEIIILDNEEGNEKNETQKVIEEIDSQLVVYFKNEKNLGMLGNWNRAIELCETELLTYCHDDDTFLPGSLETLYTIHKEYPNKSVFGNHNTINEKGEYITKVNPEQRRKLFVRDLITFKLSKWDVFTVSPGFGCGCLFYKDQLVRLGGFDEEFYPSADYALFSLLIFKFGGVFTNLPTFNYRRFQNESNKVFDKFAEVDRHFRNCMKNKMRCPNFILSKIIDAKYRTSKIYNQIGWGNRDKDLLKEIKKSDKRVVYITTQLVNLRHSKLSF